jgi:hypothetical protein
MLLIIAVVAVVLGIGTGYAFAAKSGTTSSPSVTKTGDIDTSSVKKGDVFGTDDTSTFKDTAEGTLKAGGIEGEGQFHLVRPGGDSQNVYLVSSTVDLSKLVDKKIKVWGATQTAQHAGWLMDVGKVEVEE